MKVALCVDSLEPQLTGIGRYCWELAKRLPRCEGIEDVIFHRGGERIADAGTLVSGSFTRGKSFPFARRIARSRFRRRYAGMLFHGPNYFLPDWVESGIVTVHDLSVLRFPEMHPVERVRQFERRFRASLDRALHIITDTEWNRREVIEALGLDPARVTAIHLGVDPVFSPEAIERWPLPAGLTPNGYGLCVATLEPRKGLTTALSAWAMLPPELRQHYPLVIAGSDGWPDEAVTTALARAEREGWLIRLGYMPEAALPTLYAGAKLFVFPSVYEGFGLPPVEAMACGTPAIVSDRACLPEVTADAAMLVDPADVDHFSRAIAQGLTDDAWRATAREKGLALARRYSWPRCVEETAKLYHRMGC